jgi:hypothetical protein
MAPSGLAELERLGKHDEFDEGLYISAYHLTKGDDPGWGRAEIWVEALAVGSPLPKMPLFLRVGPMMSVDFDLPRNLSGTPNPD